MNQKNKLQIKKINSLLDHRDILLSQLSEGEHTSDNIEHIQTYIIDNIMKHYNKFDIDFILETLTRFGQAPSLVYDDNGLFAVSSDGMQPVVMGDERAEYINVCVEYDSWKPTIREALWYYLHE